MGAHPYWYVVDHEEPLQAALDRLRERELQAGRYHPVVMFPAEDPHATPGQGHGSIEEAMAAADADGTRSILDIASIAEEPEYCAAAPLTVEELQEVFGTLEPPAAALGEPPGALFALVPRGMARYVIGYEAGAPRKILFVGYSFD